MTPSPNVTIIIPVLNRAADLRRCLESLGRQTVSSSQFDVLVVDNGSTDDSAQVAREWGARVITETRRGPAHARNRGIQASEGDWIAFIDSDCVAHPDWLERLLRPTLDTPAPGFCAGALLPGSLDTSLERYIAARGIMDPERCMKQDDFSFPFAMTANAFFSRKALELAGGFDPSLRVGEDADLCWRIAWAGFEGRYLPEARVDHYHRTSLSSFAHQVFGYGEGTVALYKKHRSQLTRPWQPDLPRYRRMIAAPFRRLLALRQGSGEDVDWLTYEMIDLWAFAAGRLYGCLKHRVWFF